MMLNTLKVLLCMLCADSFIIPLVYATDRGSGAAAAHQNVLAVPHDDAETQIDLFRPPLRAQGRYIIDANDKRFKLASMNWYGSSDELFVPGGLDVQPRDKIVNLIRSLGFNSVRLPYSDEMVLANPVIPSHLLAANKDLVGSRALDVFGAVVTSLTEAGLAVIINNHITKATWCCGANPCDAAWYNDYLGSICRVRQTEDQWLENWMTVMEPFVNNPRVVAVDLRNEVRGLWGTMTWDCWAKAAERAGNKLLELQPDWLVVVEGTSSANDLSGVLNRPIVLNVADRVVYSAHVYSWSGWGSLQGRYARRSFESFVRSMQENWSYLLEQNLAPVWVGEMGAPRLPNSGEKNYWDNLLKYLKEIDADFAYWAINPRKPHGDEQETYSIVEDDWETPVVDDYRMRDMLELMTQ